jgi:H2-forming N5,N10-methylenetetrahydromethanopterin dehydrogenase-like enzyme
VKNSTKIPSADQEIQEIVNMAQCIEGEGLSDMVHGEAEELLQAPNYELAQEDLDELMQSSTDVEEKEEQEETNVNQWTLESFADQFKNFRNIKHKFRELDPSIKRSTTISRELKQTCVPYTTLYNEMKQKKAAPYNTVFS